MTFYRVVILSLPRVEIFYTLKKFKLTGQNLLQFGIQEDQMVRMWSACTLYCALTLSSGSHEMSTCKLSHILHNHHLRYIVQFFLCKVSGGLKLNNECRGLISTHLCIASGISSRSSLCFCKKRIQFYKLTMEMHVIV